MYLEIALVIPSLSLRNYSLIFQPSSHCLSVCEFVLFYSRVRIRSICSNPSLTQQIEIIMRLQQILFAALASTAVAAPILKERACTAQGNGGGLNENGVVNNNCCTDVTIIFARGTAEFGNVGTFAGPPFFKSLRAKLGVSRVTVQGVKYPADLLVGTS